MRVTDTAAINRATKPAYRTAQGKPTWGMRYCTTAGKMTLPVPVPMAVTASA